MDTGLKVPVRGGFALPGLVASAHIDVEQTLHDSAVEIANLVFLASVNKNDKPYWGVTKEGLLYEKAWWTFEYWSWSTASLAEDVLQGRIKDTLDIALVTHGKAIEVLQKKKLYKPEEQSKMEVVAKKVEEYFPKALVGIRNLEAHYPQIVAAHVASTFSNSLRWTTLVKLSDVKQDTTQTGETGGTSPTIIQSTFESLGPKPVAPPPLPPTGYKPKKIATNGDQDTARMHTLKGEATAEVKETARLQKESFSRIGFELKRKAEARRALLDAVEEAKTKLDKFIPAKLKLVEESAKITAELAIVCEKQKSHEVARSRTHSQTRSIPEHISPILMQSKIVLLKLSSPTTPGVSKPNVPDSTNADEISSIFAQLKPGASVRPSMLRRTAKTEEKDTAMMQSVIYDVTHNPEKPPARLGTPPPTEPVPAAVFEPKKKTIVNNVIVSEVLQNDENFLHRSRVMAMSIDSLNTSMELDPNKAEAALFSA